MAKKKAKKLVTGGSLDKPKRRRRRKEWKFVNFENVLALPERLAVYLRLLLHLDKISWDFCLDKLRQHLSWSQVEEKKRPKVQIIVKGKVRTSNSGPVYLQWSKSKGRGKGRRYFAAPCDELGKIQKALLHRFLSQVFVHFARHGGQIGASIITNAEHHAGFAKAVFSMDIVNAYPTVYRSRVKATLRKPFEFVLRQFRGVDFKEDDVLKMLDSIVDLVVFKDRLPQGPSTSPRIFDIVCGKMDQEIFQELEMNATPFQSYRYTAWTDNLTISSDGEVPQGLRDKLVGIIRQNGFFPHTREDKMRYFSPETGEVPIITGLVLGQNGAITMAPRKLNQLRARLHNLLSRKTWDNQLRGDVAGTLGYVRQVYPDKVPSKLREHVASAESRLASMKLAVATEEVIEELEEQEEKETPTGDKPKDDNVSEAILV